MFFFFIMLMVTIEMLYINHRLSQQLVNIEEKQEKYISTMDYLDESSDRTLTKIKESYESTRLDLKYDNIRSKNIKDHSKQYKVILAAN